MGWKYIPTRLISRLFGWISRIPIPKWILVPFLNWYCQYYRVNTAEMGRSLNFFQNFTEFFTRSLKPGSRTVYFNVSGRTFLAGVDGVLNSYGTVTQQSIVQIKGHAYPIASILHHKSFSSIFDTGTYFVLYLSPGEYHRIHGIYSGRIVGWEYTPGHLYPVNRRSVQRTQFLYAINERLTTYIQTQEGLIALIKIGAFNVGKIKVCYKPDYSSNRFIGRSFYEDIDPSILISHGDEVGRFELGSTLIIITQHPAICLKNAGDTVRWNEDLGKFNSNPGNP